MLCVEIFYIRTACQKARHGAEGICTKRCGAEKPGRARIKCKKIGENEKDVLQKGEKCGTIIAVSSKPSSLKTKLQEN